MKRRVVVTGLGVVTSLGRAVDLFWDRLVRGDSGVGPITLFDVTGYVNFTKTLRLSAGLYNVTDRQYWYWQDVRELSSTRADLMSQIFTCPPSTTDSTWRNRRIAAGSQRACWLPTGV